MNEIDKTKLSDQTKFKLDERKKWKIILTQKSIKENYAVKKLSKYASTFNYIEKILIVLNATTGVCIISHATVVGALVGIASADLRYYLL